MRALFRLLRSQSTTWITPLAIKLLTTLTSTKLSNETVPFHHHIKKKCSSVISPAILWLMVCILASITYWNRLKQPTNKWDYYEIIIILFVPILFSRDNEAAQAAMQWLDSFKKRAWSFSVSVISVVSSWEGNYLVSLKVNFVPKEDRKVERHSPVQDRKPVRNWHRDMLALNLIDLQRNLILELGSQLGGGECNVQNLLSVTICKSHKNITFFLYIIPRSNRPRLTLEHFPHHKRKR